MQTEVESDRGRSDWGINQQGESCALPSRRSSAAARLHLQQRHCLALLPPAATNAGRQADGKARCHGHTLPRARPGGTSGKHLDPVTKPPVCRPRLRT